MRNTRCCSPNFRFVWNPTRLYAVRSAFSARSCSAAQGLRPVRGVGQPHGLERAEPRRVLSLARDLLDGLARLEQVARLEVAQNRAVGVDELADEGLVLLFVERCVQVIALLGALRVGCVLVAALSEHTCHVERFRRDDRRRRVEEGKRLLPGKVRDVRGESIARERARRHDDGRCAGSERLDRRDLAAHERDVRALLERFRHMAGKLVSVDRERAAGRNGVGLRLAVEERPEPVELVLLHTGGRCRLHALERVRAHELRRVPGLVHRRAHRGAHLVQLHPEAAACELQGRLASGKARPHDDDGLFVCDVSFFHGHKCTRHTLPARVRPRRPQTFCTSAGRQAALSHTGVADS
jgi:hypothetical protein